MERHLMSLEVSAKHCRHEAADTIGDRIDAAAQSAVASLTGGISPASLAGAYGDWAIHAASAPGKCLELAEIGWRQWIRLSEFALHARDRQCPLCIEPLPQDKRFRAEAWKQFPYNVAAQAFLLGQQWWHRATKDIPGVSAHHADMVTFGARQLLDMAAPSNFIATNPEVIEAIKKEGGFNLLRGAIYAQQDAARHLLGQPPVGTDAFPVGKKVALTPGKVVLRNELMELIQYSPAAKTVYPEPVLIVPAWIMKYYILDLQPHNSLVKFLVDRGHTVFMISWKNPEAADSHFGMDDYLNLGPLAALDAIAAIVPRKAVHGAGYCLGGTLLAIAAAKLARERKKRLASMTLLAAQVDFSEPGELSLFIDEGQISYLEHLMRDKGVLDAAHMAGAFRLLRSNDLVWSYRVRNYLLGKREPPSDLMSWNADGTRLPYRMHSEYLRSLFLRNELATGRYCVDGKPVALSDIRVPVFAVGTLFDHVAPWRSVYKIHMLTETDVTFALTTAGHNVGIVADPADKSRHYQIRTQPHRAPYVDAESWRTKAEEKEGSWWFAWQAWLASHSGRRTRAPALGSVAANLPPLCDAPGVYVRAH
jgi:polyhydroxyalkanoate synthase subunit PhaC